MLKSLLLSQSMTLKLGTCAVFMYENASAQEMRGKSVLAIASELGHHEIVCDLLAVGAAAFPQAKLDVSGR